MEKSFGNGPKKRYYQNEDIAGRKLTNRSITILLIILISICAGCRTTRILELNESSISPGKVQEIVRTHHTRIQSMKGEGQISIETPDVAQTGSFILNLQKPDSVLINLEGPFGIKVGSALVTRTGFVFYNRWENKLITGSSSMENLDRILHVKLSFDDLLDLFAGGTFLEDDLRLPDRTSVEDDHYVFTYSSSDCTRQYSIDPETYSIQRIRFFDGSGNVTLEQTFSNFEDIEGMQMPYTIRITQPKFQQMLSLTYYDILVNTDQLQFTIKIPSNVERIHW